MGAQLFAKVDSTAEGCWGYVHTYYGVAPPPFFDPSRSLPVHVQTGKFLSSSGAVILSLCVSKAQLLPLTLSLECLGKTKL